MEEQTSTKKIWIVGAMILIAILGGAYLLFTSRGKETARQILEKPIVVEEKLVIPDTKSVAVADTRIPNKEAYNVPLVPQSGAEKVVVPNAVLTLKESHTKADINALAWAPDAKLALIKSLGAVTLEGKSSEWQVVFGSKVKKGGYEVIIQGDAVVSKKEIISKIYGYDLPKNWYDTNDAIKSLQSLPQFVGATVSGINFFFNADSKEWMYGIATSKGATAMPVR